MGSLSISKPLSSKPILNHLRQNPSFTDFFLSIPHVYGPQMLGQFQTDPIHLLTSQTSCYIILLSNWTQDRTRRLGMKKQNDQGAEAMDRIPDDISDNDLSAAWVDQLATAQSQIQSVLHGYLSDDGLDYLTSALDLAQGLTADYHMDNSFRYSQFLIGLAGPPTSSGYLPGEEVPNDYPDDCHAHDIDYYACDGISDKLNDIVHRIAKGS